MSIKINNKTKSFTNAPLLKNISIDLEEGMYRLVGPNGSGKSTLIRLIAGFDKFDDGFKLTPKENTLYLTTDSIGISPFSLKENIEILWHAFNVKLTSQEIDMVNKLFQINLDCSYSRASTGTKAKVGLSLLFAKQWDTILIDETLSPLDRYSVDCIAKQLKKQSKGATVIYVSHNLANDILEKESRILKIIGGRVIEEE